MEPTKPSAAGTAVQSSAVRVGRDGHARGDQKPQAAEEHGQHAGAQSLGAQHHGAERPGELTVGKQFAVGGGVRRGHQSRPRSWAWRMA